MLPVPALNTACSLNDATHGHRRSQEVSGLNLHAMNTAESSPLGKAVDYAGGYDPDLLFPIPRAAQRANLGLGAELPFVGGDIWNAYELSWLDRRGRPQVALARIDVPADSSHIIESKSLKLYLNGFNQERLDSADALSSRMRIDLGRAAGAEVDVALSSPMSEAGSLHVGSLDELIDDAPVDCTQFGPPQADMLRSDANSKLQEQLISHAFKSNCPVTGQPDWATMIVRYAGPRIDRGALLQYLVSFRQHADFHEHCVERIFLDLMTQCRPDELFVHARYTRRGGLDINPWRSSRPMLAPDNARWARQ